MFNSFWGNLLGNRLARRPLHPTTAERNRTRPKYRPAFDLLEDRTTPALTAPLLASPMGVMMDPTPAFSWNAVTGAGYYDILVNNYTTGQSSVLRNSHVNGTSWTTTTTLNFGQTYQWQVRAFTSSGVAGPWSTLATFDLTHPFAGSYSGTTSNGLTNTLDPIPDLTVTAEVDAAGKVTVFEPGPGTGWVNLSGAAEMAGTFGFGSVTDATYTFTGNLVVSHSPGVQIIGLGTWHAVWDTGSGDGDWNVTANGSDLLGTPLDASVLTSPSGLTTNTKPTFQWGAVDGAAYYEVWVDNVTTSQTRVLQNLYATTTSWTPTVPLTPGQDYEWWVKAIDATGNTSPVSGPTGFSVSFLETPTLASPTGSITVKNPTLTWNAVSNATGYQVWVQDAGSGATVVNKSVTTPNLPVTLTVGRSYEWRVKALSSAGNLGFWSTPATFTINVGTPVPTAPSGSIQNARPPFSWSAAANASSYDVRLDDMTTGVSQVKRVTTLTWTPATLIPGHTYAWWVRGISSNSVAGAWAGETVFTLNPLAKPVPIAPTGFIQDSTMTFSWGPVANADYYALTVKDMSAAAKVVVQNPKIIGAAWTTTTAFTVGHDYQWTVRALSNNGNTSTWSDASYFTLSNPFAGFYVGTYVGNTTEGPVGPEPVEASVNVAGAIKVMDPGSGTGTVNYSGGTVMTGKGVGTVEDAVYRFIGTLTIVGGVGHGMGTWTATWPGGSGSGTWTVDSTSVVANPLDTPVQTGPAGDITALKPTFTWNAVPGANYYDIWIDDLTAGRTQAVRNTYVTTNSWTPTSNLILGHQYQWRVEAYSTAGESSAWSAYSPFKLILAKPNPVLPFTPGVNPTYSWDAVENASWYDLWVYDATTNVSVRRNTKVLATSWTFGGALTAGKAYKWQVRAVNSNGTVSAWSDAQQFTA